jgi:acyl-CoA dehydrogenase
VAECAADIQAARLMTLHAAWRIDSAGAGAARDEIGLIKFFGAHVLHRVVDRAIQVHGAAGVSEDHPLSMFYRQARLARIYDGPDEVHKMVVARRILARHEPSRGAGSGT